MGWMLEKVTAELNSVFSTPLEGVAALRKWVIKKPTYP